MLKNTCLIGGGGGLAVIFAAVLSFAGPYDYAFPSPMPPTGDTAGVKQYVTFIWDDNSYSGKNGTNYEGSNFPTSNKAFADNSWTGGLRLEAGGLYSKTSFNNDNLREGDYGMAWAAKSLAGYEPLQTMYWNYLVENWSTGDEVIYKDAIWRAKGWMSKGTSPESSTEDYTGWEKVRDLSSITPIKTNDDGSPITMTFNVITGLIVPSFPVNYLARESKYGYYVPNDEFYPLPLPQERHQKISITWGREYGIYTDAAAANSKDQSKLAYFSFLEDVFRETMQLGHEIGNHTIDHMETNSPLPYAAGNAYPAIGNAPGNGSGTAYMDGFAKWNGEGMDNAEIDTVTLPSGKKFITDEAKDFGQRKGNVWQYMGWKGYAGKVLSKNAWKGLISLAETELTAAYDISAQAKNCIAFRAPRLEVNSDLFWALKDLGYLYDCGNEEGYEYNMDGTNHLWPYTTDNGSPNVAWQRAVGEDMSNFDSLPYGIWEIPVAVLIVPELYRDGVWQNHKKVRAGEGDSPSDEEEVDWKKTGKITGFDFNLFILYGASKEAAKATMRYSLDQRMNGGKAPFQIGCHTDYFTPIYDNATLLNDANKKSYGLVITENMNSWSDRKDVWEDIRDYGILNGALFKSGKETIEYVKELVAKVKVGEDKKNITDIGGWEFFSHEDKSTAISDNFDGDIVNAEINTEASETEVAGYAIYGDAGDFEFDHISLSYSTSAPLTIRLITDDPIDEAYPYEITLGNLNGWDASVANMSRFVQSGQIPISAFQRNQYVGADHSSLVGLHAKGTDFTKDIIAIEVAVQVPENKSQRTLLSIKDFTLYSGEQTQDIEVGIATGKQKVAVQRITVQAMSANALKLNLAASGVYNVDVIGINGRIIKSFKNENLRAGLNTLSLGNVAKGMYMIRIHNKQMKTTLKSLVL
ncbi:MAG: hypothetical protein LBH98_04775 [Chitinispirillales bacterium]|jgi:hypothetical protein|nr:hypothetical protein [Chitinispirillales bacterium]